MASKAALKRREDENARLRLAARDLHWSAQAGVKECRLRLDSFRRSLSDLLGGPDSISRFSGRKHVHAEPFDAPDCGWCSNIHTWRGSVLRAHAALTLSIEIEKHLIALASGRSQNAFWKIVQKQYPNVRRELARDIHATVKAAEAAQEGN